MAEKVVVRGIKTLSFYAVELNNKLRAGDGIRTRENCLEGSYVTNYITPAYCKQCTPAASIVHIVYKEPEERLELSTSALQRQRSTN